MLGNVSYTTSPFPPRVLFAYNIESTNSQAQINTILIIAAIVAIVLLIFIIIGGIIFLIKNSSKVEVVTAASSDASMDLQSTVGNYVFSPIPQGSAHTNTMPRRSVRFPEMQWLGVVIDILNDFC